MCLHDTINEKPSSVSESVKMPPKKAGGRPKKTASGYRMPDHLNPGTVLTDLYKKQVSFLPPLDNLLILIDLVGPRPDGGHWRVRRDLPRQRGWEGGSEGSEDRASREWPAVCRDAFLHLCDVPGPP